MYVDSREVFSKDVVILYKNSRRHEARVLQAQQTTSPRRADWRGHRSYLTIRKT
jgi:hypothetical protein